MLESGIKRRNLLFRTRMENPYRYRILEERKWFCIFIPRTAPPAAPARPAPLPELFGNLKP